MFVNQLSPLEEQPKPTFTKHLQHYHLPGIMLYTGKLSVLKTIYQNTDRPYSYQTSIQLFLCI